MRHGGGLMQQPRLALLTVFQIQVLFRVRRALVLVPQSIAITAPRGVPQSAPGTYLLYAKWAPPVTARIVPQACQTFILIYGLWASVI